MRLHKWFITVFFVAALIGFADSAYLTAQHIRGVIPPCVVLSNCEQVLTSKYASIGPVPVAALGLLYYATILVLLIAYWDIGNRKILHWASWIVSAGMLGTLYFIYVQAFVLHAFCPYCLLSAASTLVMFGVAVAIMRAD